MKIKIFNNSPTLGSEGSKDLLTSVAQLSNESALLLRRSNIEGNS